MNASPRSPHKGWQFHLGTGLALMLLAAVLVGLNLTPNQGGSIFGMHAQYYQDRGLGWPMHFYVIELVEMHTGETSPGRFESLDGLIFGGLFDFAISLTSLAVCGRIVEGEIRLRARMRATRRVLRKIKVP